MSASDSEDDLIIYGTPLEPLEEDEIPNKKPRLLEDQVVTDKQGRRRFHGAFTGGFSAGFFNTVGSLEGWTPSAFKSSKSNKQEVFRQKPEDFMDEEDMSEFGIAPVVLKARQGYTIEKGKDAHNFTEFRSIGTYVLQDALRHVRETVGIKLLKKMGWKTGQGVGPRLNKNEKKNSLKILHKTYGCQLPPSSIEEKEEIDSDSGSEWEDIEFAPSDYEPILCQIRTNFCGLGYEGLDKRPILSGNSHSKGEKGVGKNDKKFGFGSQAFGVGAFEEEDDDVYEKDDMSRYNFFLGKDESTDTSKSTDQNTAANDDVLEGFYLGAKAIVKKMYPLPVIPKDLKPHHRVRRSRFDQPPTNERGKIDKGSKINFENRRGMIENSRVEVTNVKKEQEILAVKKLISNVKTKESKFKPFSSNSEKQERYDNYLKLIEIGRTELLSDLQPFSMTDWDRERERAEFEKAASLFKPLTGGMEDRFSTASQPDDLSDPLAVVERYSDENDDRRKAAKMKMFGALTRITENWVPVPLLCKRFNIPEPKLSASENTEKPKKKSSFNLFTSVQSFAEKLPTQEKTEKCRQPEESPVVNLVEKENIPKKIIEDTAISENEDKTDLFKAIFLDSDDEDKVGEEDNDPKEQEPRTIQEKPIRENFEEDIVFEEKLINSKRNSSPPKGIFKNIDLELLSGTKKTEESEEPKNRTTEVIKSTKEDALSLDLVYGPQLPEKVVTKTGGVFTSQLQEDVGVWVEKKKKSEKKHKKKEKKSKKASHKSKHKHKHKK